MAPQDTGGRVVVVVGAVDPVGAVEIDGGDRVLDVARGLDDRAIRANAIAVDVVAVLPDQIPVIDQVVDQDVPPVAARIADHVVATAGDDGVVALAARQDVPARAARQAVAAAVAEDRVVARAADHDVVAAAARDQVVVGVARHQVGAQAAEAEVVAVQAVDLVVVVRADDPIGAVGAHDHRLPGHADDIGGDVPDPDLVAVDEAQPLHLPGALEPVLDGQAVAGQHLDHLAVDQGPGRIVGGQLDHQVLTIGARALDDQVAHGHADAEHDGVLAALHRAVDLVVPVAGPVAGQGPGVELGDAIVERVSGRAGDAGRIGLVEQNVIAVAIAEHVLVRARAAEDRGHAAGLLVVAAPALEDVAAGPADQHIDPVAALQPVRPRAAIQAIVPRPAVQQVAVAAVDGRGRRRIHNHRPAGLQRRLSDHPGRDHVAREQGVVTVLAKQPVVQLAADDLVVPGPAQHVVAEVTGADDVVARAGVDEGGDGDLEGGRGRRGPVDRQAARRGHHIADDRDIVGGAGARDPGLRGRIDRVAVDVEHLAFFADQDKQPFLGVGVQGMGHVARCEREPVGHPVQRGVQIEAPPPDPVGERPFC